MSNNVNLLEVKDLKVTFHTGRRVVKAVDGVSFHIAPGETLGLVGESGCGKSTTARAIMRLEPVTGGTVFFDGEDITALQGRGMRKVYQKAQIIFQDPYASLNPRMTAGNIVGEPLKNFNVMRGAELENKVRDLFRTVGLDPRFINRYPHEFSGGQRQRIGVARALSIDPKLIICDEPVSALDVSIRAQIINLLEELQEKFGFSYLFISHDLSVVKHISDRVAVMYLGRIVETAPGDEIYRNPLHPYTKALLSAIPIPDPEVERKRQRVILTGDTSAPLSAGECCSFQDRCPVCVEKCKTAQPALVEVSQDHFVSCHEVAAVGAGR